MLSYPVSSCFLKGYDLRGVNKILPTVQFRRNASADGPLRYDSQKHLKSCTNVLTAFIGLSETISSGKVLLVLMIIIWFENDGFYTKGISHLCVEGYAQFLRAVGKGCYVVSRDYIITELTAMYKHLVSDKNTLQAFAPLVYNPQMWRIMAIQNSLRFITSPLGPLLNTKKKLWMQVT